MVGMSFDGASVMAGVRGGVQELLRQRQSFHRAIFFHCWAHRLNLSVVDICALIPRVRRTFNTLQVLYNFISGSAVHIEYVRLRNELMVGCKIEIQSLSETRWWCRRKAVKII